MVNIMYDLYVALGIILTIIVTLALLVFYDVSIALNKKALDTDDKYKDDDLAITVINKSNQPGS